QQRPRTRSRTIPRAAVRSCGSIAFARNRRRRAKLRTKGTRYAPAEFQRVARPQKTRFHVILATVARAADSRHGEAGGGGGGRAGARLRGGVEGIGDAGKPFVTGAALRACHRAALNFALFERWRKMLPASAAAMPFLRLS